ncbi:hypothetical protein GLA29479_3686 [Lysobacter antibioticus]|nr:hypothetical protein GLA29479_3686 [Lysobacter antibioticus]
MIGLPDRWALIHSLVPAAPGRTRGRALHHRIPRPGAHLRKLRQPGGRCADACALVAHIAWR